MRSFKLRLLTGIGAGALCAATLSIAHAKVDVTPRIAAQATWTDNVNLDRNDKSSDVVLSATPGVNIKMTSNRITGDIDYSPTAMLFLSDTDASDIRQHLRGSVDAELVREIFFVGAGASIGQRFGNLDGPLSGSEFNITNNRRTVQNYYVRPYLKKEIGTFANMSASYTYGFNNVSNPKGTPNPISDSERHSADAVLSSGKRFNRLGWTLNGKYDQIDRGQVGARFEQKMGRANISYALGRKIALVGSAGYEDISDTTLRRKQEGFIWDAGVRLTPGPRTQLEVRGGQRYGDNVYSGNLSYRLSEKYSLQASYDENISVFQRFSLENLQDIVGVVNGLPVDANGNIVIIDDSDVTLTDEAYRSKNFTLRLNYQSRRHGYSLQLFRYDRNYDTLTFDSVSYGGRFNYNLKLNGRQNVHANIMYRRIDYDTRPNTDFYNVNLTYEIRLSKAITAFAGARHSTSSNGGALQDYKTNSVSIGARATF